MNYDEEGQAIRKDLEDEDVEERDVDLDRENEYEEDEMANDETFYSTYAAGAEVK